VLATALALLPPLVLLHLIRQHGVNVPVLDEWRWSVQHVLDGDLARFDLARFWTLDNEHRVFVPLLVGTALAHASGLSMLPPLYLKLALAAGLVLVFRRLYARLTGLPHAPAVVLPLSVLVFGLAQWPRWIDVRPLPSTFSLLGLAGALLFASSGPRSARRFAGAALCAWISSSSYFSGNVTWVVVGPVLFVAGWGRRWVAGWFALAALVLGNYAYDFLGASTTTSAHVPAAPLELVRFVLVFLGSPCSSAARNAAEQGQTLAYGALGLTALVALAWTVVRQTEDGLRKSAPWLALATWTLVNAAAAAFGRAEAYGELGARAARYTVFGTQFWVALAMLATVALFEPLRGGVRSVRGIGLAAALLTALGAAGGVLGMLASGGLDAHAQQLRLARTQLLLGEGASSSKLAVLHRQPDALRERLPALIERRAAFLYGEHALLPAAAEVAGQAQPLRRGFSWRLRDVIAAWPETKLAWDIELLERPHVYLSVGLTLEETSPPKWARIVLRESGETTELFRAQLSEHAPHVTFHRFDLSAWVGRTVTIELQTKGAGARRVLFVDPAVVYDVLERERP
jgi:hypothetical protein